ncbi:leucine-rich repeat domain-containing protein [Fusobacterium massiliense]|jgi:hypothetical protein|uniref:leucine-rich repeat domain-containing protein n=1 Tax=Fusobacterium massiliense TaxID=1852365 RepID=UPI00093A8480|nr:leucine-rich repeat domain-containing protein [Fusobacterium massiliense]
MDQNLWEYDDFIFKGDELKGMTAKGKDKVKTGGQTDLVIPATTPDGLPVKKIADNAFYRRGLTSVVIPETVESIGYDAFGVCKLKEVKLPEALVNIEGFAFYRNKLTKVEFGSKVKKLEPSSFALNELSEISLPEGLEYIGASAFFKNAFSSITIPASVQKIDMYAFKKNNIGKVVVPSTVNLHINAFEANTTVERA